MTQMTVEFHHQLIDGLRDAHRLLNMTVAHGSSNTTLKRRKNETKKDIFKIYFTTFLNFKINFEF